MSHWRDFCENKQISKNCEFVSAHFSKLARGRLAQQICFLQKICESWLVEGLDCGKYTQDSQQDMLIFAVKKCQVVEEIQCRLCRQELSLNFCFHCSSRLLFPTNSNPFFHSTLSLDFEKLIRASPRRTLYSITICCHRLSSPKTTPAFSSANKLMSAKCEIIGWKIIFWHMLPQASLTASC